MTLLAINWDSFFIKAAQFVLSFSILVVLHELGHFLPARWFKCRVEKFYLFFNPWFSLVKKKIGETEYGIGWIPFGGYVKISGMIDESMDKEQMKLPPQPYEFRSKPAWQRLIIMLGGITVNVLLAIVIFIGIMWHWGEDYIPNNKLTYGIYADSLAQKIGLHDGDKIVSLDHKPIDNYRDIGIDIVLNGAKTIQVNRDGKNIDIAIPDTYAAELNKDKLEHFISPQFPHYIDSVGKEVKIIKGSLQKGDRIIATNGVATPYYHQYFLQKKNKKDEPLPITLLRNDKDTIQTTVMLSSAGTIGFMPRTPDKVLGDSVKKYSFFEAIPAGTKACFDFLGKQINGYKQIVTGKVKASDSLGSVISIGNTFPDKWNWQRFWMLTAMFSIMLAFINVLPIPGLDGGHALFTIAEIITGKKPSDKFMEYAQVVGMILLLSLMVYALGLDFWRVLK